MKWCILLVAIYCLVGCGGSCEGYISPNAAILVKDAITLEIIDFANVEVKTESESGDKSVVASFVREGEGFHQKHIDRYFAYLESYSSVFEVSTSVTAEGYEPWNSGKEVMMEETYCMAENRYQKEVHLCPINVRCD